MYFLGIVNEANLVQGLIVPAYYLCQSKGTSANRSGLRVINATSGMRVLKMPKVLVDKPYGHDDLIMFLSKFRTRTHMHRGKYRHRSTQKYYPVGALFWFKCDQYGSVNGPAIFVKKIPEKHAPHEREALECLRESNAKYNRDKAIGKLTEDGFMDLEYSNRKVKFVR